MGYYGAKLRDWEEGIFSENSIYRNPSQPEQELENSSTQIPIEHRQQQFDSETFEISTYTSYINKNGNPGVIIRPRSRDLKIYSFLIIGHKEYISYSINKRTPNGIREMPIIDTNLEKLFEDDWIEENRPAYLELYVIKETIETQKSQIERHLRTTL
jgi:hypothetical protein